MIITVNFPIGKFTVMITLQLPFNIQGFDDWSLLALFHGINMVFVFVFLFLGLFFAVCLVFFVVVVVVFACLFFITL